MNKSITIALIIFSTSIFAQNQVAKKVLDKLSATTRSYENISVEFDFILENKSQNVKEIQQGTQQSTQALTQTTVVTTKLTFLADEFNQMVTELQGENETGDKQQV